MLAPPVSIIYPILIVHLKHAFPTIFPNIHKQIKMAVSSPAFFKGYQCQSNQLIIRNIKSLLLLIESPKLPPVRETPV